MNLKRSLVVTLMLLVVLSAVPQLLAQSATTGDITGTVTDPNGAVITGATVTLKNNANGSSQTTTTSDKGFYRFSFLAPGEYVLTVAASGFQPSTRTVAVGVNRVNDQDFKMSVTAVTQTVEVTAEAPLLQTEEANVATNYSEQQVKLVPNPGNDLSFVAQTSPGAVMNTQSGFGNFSTFGLPATSNLFTLDGQNDNDPFLNLNNSGATNLLLGQNEIAEATVTNNGYTGQYGQLAGATINYVTKSGTNKWHGNAIWWWNGRTMNANNWFNNHTIDPTTGKGVPRAFDNANQWAASFGGPIKKDKLWFFVDYEGLRVVLPTSVPVTIPTPAFQTQILTVALPGAGMTAASTAYYTNMFNLWNSAAGAASAQPIPMAAGGGCGGFDNTNASNFGAFGTTLPCAETFRSTAGNFTHEWLLGTRVDWQVGNNDKMFFRVQHDVGVQATSTDPIDPVFNAVSTQPEWQGQVSETHVFGSGAVNNLVVSAQWYSAIFKPINLPAALAKFPTTLQLGDGTLTTLGGLDFIWPQGRNVTQYQAVDDFSKTFGNHTLKVGLNFHRNDVSDFDFGFFQSGLEIPLTLDAFVNGGTDPNPAFQFPAGASPNISILLQSFPQSLNQPMALYGLGWYVQDEWRARHNLTITLSLRFDHNSNPVCQHNCFANLTSPFTSIAKDPMGTAVPYNQTIKAGLHQAYPSADALLLQPRVGFAWSPWSKTVIRGGFGLFYDQFPATIVDNFAQNPPFDTQFTAACNNLAPGETAANGCGLSGNMFTDAAAAEAAFLSGFAAGQTEAQVAAVAGPAFVAPNITTSDHKIKSPQYQEWNLAIQQGIGKNLAITVNYVGNHGIYEPIQNFGLNTWCPANAANADFPGESAGPCFGAVSPFNGVFPTPPSQVTRPLAPDARFTTVNQIQSIGVSNYNGLVTSVQYRFTGGQLQFNYTYSHALDIISNGGLLPFNDTTNVSLLSPQDPFHVRASYGNADYDVRHYVSMNYYWELPFQKIFHASGGWDRLYRGWVISGTVFHRTGLPFTVTDSASTGLISSFGYGATVFAGPTAPPPGSCGSGAASLPDGSPAPPSAACLNTSMFLPAGQTAFGNQARNQYRGPGFFDADFTIVKNTKLTSHWEGAELGIGFQFFNILNHPNFDQPVRDLSDPFFGTITRTVNTPTSILGSFLGGDASPRLIQFTIRLQF